MLYITKFQRISAISAIVFPAASSKQDVYVTIQALEGGHLTLPEGLFVTDAEPGRKKTLPLLFFLIQHRFSRGDLRSRTWHLAFTREWRDSTSSKGFVDP